jgi:polynucleotide 5'-triphosphatase
MNVGLILNSDLPGDGRAKRPEITSQQRHSLVNLLNDSVPSASAATPKRNLIANITNDRDVDIATGVASMDKIDEPKAGELRLAPGATRSGAVPGGLAPKPRRYSAPPIWAREAGPGAFGRGNGGSAEVVDTEAALLTSKHVFNTAQTVSVDLECLITGTIPPPSLTRTVAEWIYANFTEIPSDQRKHVELELKFGTIIDKRASHRIDIDVLTECIYTNTANTYFDNGVHEVGWQDMCKFFDELEKKYQDELRKPHQQPRPKHKFNTLESDITDTFFQVTQRNERPKKIRVSKDNQLSPPRYTAINKQRINDLYIHNPSSMYDLRLLLLYEHPIPDSDIEGILRRQTPTLTRVKKRLSWSHRPTVTRFDMTRVLQPRELKNKAGKKIVEQDQSYEVELEVDVLELFAGFDKFKSGEDAIRFEELVEIFVNNARCLNNRVTKLASK